MVTWEENRENCLRREAYLEARREEIRRRDAADKSYQEFRKWQASDGSCGGGSMMCFVATAVYGDVDAPQVQTLREFRDNVLVKYSAGRKFVDFYYSGAGEKTANFVKTHLPSTIPVIRAGLDLLVEKYSNKK